MPERGLRVSVVVPNFNSGAVLRRALESVLNQTYRNYQLIVVDSLSTDETPAIIDEFAAYIDVCIREKDKGHADGLNKGFAHATGDIYCWLCADDELTPRALASIVDIFRESRDVDLVVGACERIFPDGTRSITRPPKNPLATIAFRDDIEQPSAFWRAELHRQIGAIPTRFYLIFDWEWWCLMSNAGARAVTTDQVLSRYHFGFDNKSSKAGARFAEESRQLLIDYGPLRGWLGRIYSILFWHFDMHGCYDRPPTCTPLRGRVFGWFVDGLARLIGDSLIRAYNWHFAALQARGLKWW